MSLAKLSAAIKVWVSQEGVLPEAAAEVQRAAKVVIADKKHVLPGWSPTYLSRLGNVKTIVDVGVLNGTPALYKAFPDAYLVLVEALPDYKVKCDGIIADRPGETHMVAAGAEDDMVVITQLEDAPKRSSILAHVVGGSEFKRRINVPIHKLDTLFADKCFAEDILLKIDTEGYEYNVILGAKEFLTKVKFVIAETSVRIRHENSYRFADLIGLMKANGFDVFDVMTVTRPGPNQPGASIIDVVFVNSSLLSAKPT